MFASIAASVHAAQASQADEAIEVNRLVVRGLEQPITIERDGYGVPTIRGERFLDVIFGHGFVHAQDRLFQMDGTRRMAAGELAAMVGPTMLDTDKQARRYRFRDVAKRIVAGLNDADRNVLESYTAGVNAAIDQMTALPFEYGILNAQPEPWRPEDSVLVLLNMFDMLHVEALVERQLGVMYEALPEELARFLTPRASRLDALLLPRVLNEGKLVNDWQPMQIPGPEIVDLRANATSDLPADLVKPSPIVLGSNNWAVAGSRTKDGRAIMANDPHLPMLLPAVWYRAKLEWNGGRVIGLSLAGAPGITIGSNDHVAWGFTNMMGDFQDLIVIEVHPDDPTRYRVPPSEENPDEYESFGEVVELIEVRGRGVDRLTLRTTRWGVVTDEDWQGRPLVLKWTALEPDMVNFRILDMMTAATLDEAVEVARSWYGPSQNITIADDRGRIAMVVCGYLPKRAGFDGRRPMSWACGTIGWDGHIDEADRPVVINPPEGFVFTANNRTKPLDHAKRLGGIWTAGTRARRIGEMLLENGRVDERDLFEMQHDTRVALFDFYRDALLNAAENAPPQDELSQRGLQILREWNGRADMDQPAVNLLTVYRRELNRRIIAPLVAPCRELDRGFFYQWYMSDEPLMRIIEEQPEHLLPAGEANWDEFLLTMWRDVLGAIERGFGGAPPGIDTPWGEVNQLRMTHPLSQGMPFLANRLNLPPVPQAGHGFAVRVASPRFGASARMVVSPGRIEDAILQTPGGQSGYAGSPHYHDLHDDWLNMVPTPMLPGPVRSRIELAPQ